LTGTDYHDRMTDPHPPEARSAAPRHQAMDAASDAHVLETDVLVIGGGPAGTTAATFLARQGWRVLLLEKDHHPRFHIGESLLPMNLPILERLGVLEQVHAIGTFKAGADFPLACRKPDGTDYNTFRFDRALNPVFPHAYQVHRAEFDQLLFAHAGRCGVDAREGVTVETHRVRRDGRPCWHTRVCRRQPRSR
jgi:2-polyprenyl-6-methoxyphenol hydroxylase-like FAD-dependent oxidoreductase